MIAGTCRQQAHAVGALQYGHGIGHLGDVADDVGGAIEDRLGKDWNAG